MHAANLMEAHIVPTILRLFQHEELGTFLNFPLYDDKHLEFHDLKSMECQVNSFQTKYVHF
jgi:hypothetical protein